MIWTHVPVLTSPPTLLSVSRKLSVFDVAQHASLLLLVSDTLRRIKCVSLTRELPPSSSHEMLPSLATSMSYSIVHPRVSFQARDTLLRGELGTLRCPFETLTVASLSLSLSWLRPPPLLPWLRTPVLLCWTWCCCYYERWCRHCNRHCRSAATRHLHLNFLTASIDPGQVFSKVDALAKRFPPLSEHNLRQFRLHKVEVEAEWRSPRL